jgi:hypothetical protein
MLRGTPLFLAILAACSDGGGVEPPPEPDAPPPPPPWRWVVVRGEAASAANASIAGLRIRIGGPGGEEVAPEGFEVCRPDGEDSDACDVLVPGGACTAGGKAVTLDVSKALLVARLPEGVGLAESDVVELFLCTGEDEGIALAASKSADPEDAASQVVLERAEHPSEGVLEATVPALPP